MQRLAILTVFALLSAIDSSAQVAVIAHQSVPADTLSRSDLLDFYTGEIKSWPDQTPVVVLDLKPKGESKTAFYGFLGKRPSRMKSIWIKRMLSGEGDPPESMNTEEELLQKVASTQGALGFVSMHRVGEDVKTLVVVPKREE